MNEQSLIDEYKQHESNYIRHDNADSFNRYDREQASHHYCKMQKIKKDFKTLFGKDMP